MDLSEEWRCWRLASPCYSNIVKIYVTARYKGAENKGDIDTLCAAVRDADMKDFCFVRDVEHYKHVFDDPKELWARTYDEIGACDALLIDVSDHPTGGRLIEAGIAYALKKPIIVIKKPGVKYKPFFDGISEKAIEYDDYKDLTQKLKRFDHDRSFNITDKSVMLAMFLLVGALIAWQSWLFFTPLAIIAPVVYWLAVRHFFASMRVFDRVVILIPLALLWLSGLWWLKGISLPLAFAWTLIYWIVAIIVLRRMKLSL